MPTQTTDSRDMEHGHGHMVHTRTLKHWSLPHTAQSSEPSHNRLLHMSRPPCLLHHGDSRLAPLAVHLTEDETPRPTVELGEAPKALLDERQQRLPVLYPRAAGLLRVKRSKRRGDVGEGRASRLVGRGVLCRSRRDLAATRGHVGEGSVRRPTRCELPPLLGVTPQPLRPSRLGTISLGRGPRGGERGSSPFQAPPTAH